MAGVIWEYQIIADSSHIAKLSYIKALQLGVNVTLTASYKQHLSCLLWCESNVNTSEIVTFYPQDTTTLMSWLPNYTRYMEFWQTGWIRLLSSKDKTVQDWNNYL